MVLFEFDSIEEDEIRRAAREQLEDGIPELTTGIAHIQGSSATYYDDLDTAISEFNSNGGKVGIPEGAWSYSITPTTTDAAVFVGAGDDATTLEYTGSGRPFDFQGNNVVTGGFSVDMSNADAAAKAGRYSSIIYGSHYPVNVDDAPNRAIEVHGTNANGGLYYNTFMRLRSNRAGTDGIAVVGDANYVQANHYGAIVGLNAGNNGFRLDVENNLGSIGLLNCESNGSDQVYVQEGTLGCTYIYAEGQSAGAYGLNVQGTNPVVIPAGHLTNEGAGPINDPNNVVTTFGGEFFGGKIQTRGVSSDEGAKRQTFGVNTSGWSTRLQTRNAKLDAVDQGSGNTMLDLRDNEVTLGVERTTATGGRSRGITVYVRTDRNPAELVVEFPSGNTQTIATDN